MEEYLARCIMRYCNSTCVVAGKKAGWGGKAFSGYIIHSTALLQEGHIAFFCTLWEVSASPCTGHNVLRTDSDAGPALKAASCLQFKKPLVWLVWV